MSSLGFYRRLVARVKLRIPSVSSALKLESACAESIELTAMQKKIHRDDFSYFVDEPPSVAQGGKGVVVFGCPTCLSVGSRSRFGTDSSANVHKLS